jgi:CHAT domain-containing protein/tetratricopeptide (TPR) repeat protein
MDDGRDQTADLVALSAVQTEAMEAFQTAVVAARATGQQVAFETYFSRARRLLAEAERYNARWPSFLNLSDVAQPLVQQLLIRADHAAAAGDRTRAESYRAEALNLTARYLGPVAAANVRRGQVIQLAAEGRFHEALESLEAARRTFIEAREVLAAAQSVLELANLYEWLGDYERALEALASVREQTADQLASGPPSGEQVLDAIIRQVDAIAEGTPTREGEDAIALRRIAYELIQTEGRIRRQLGDNDLAQELLSRVRGYAAEFGVRSGVDFHLAVIAIAMGRLDEAEATLRRIEPDFRELLRPRRPALRLAQADLELARDQAARALELVEDGIGDLITYPDDDLAWKLQLRRGRSLAALGRSRDGLAAYLAGAAAVDSLRKAPLGYRLDSTFVRDKLPLFEAGIGLAADQGDGPAAARLVELVKARALSATLSIPTPLRPGRSADEVRFDQISERLDALEFAEYSGRGSAATQQERRQLTAERERLLERLRIADPRWRTMSEPVPFDLEHILRLLAVGNRAALSLFRQPSGVVGVLLYAGQVRVLRREFASGVEEGLREYVENLRSWTPDPMLFDASAELDLTVESLLPLELVEEALAAKTLLVVPHGALHVLPWAGLTLGGRRLFEQVTVGVLPNLSCLALLDGSPPSQLRAAVLGDPDYSGLRRYPPLEHAGAEVREIAAGYGADLLVPPITGPAADEQAFWDLVGRPDGAEAVLHVCCHATLEAADPLSSGLLLTRSKVDAGEVALSRLTYSEVVLSACSTGWRPERVGPLELAGDDALGLTASFLEAGARFLLVSVPKAQDEATRAFTVRWHEHRRAGSTPLAATRATQLELLAADRNRVWSWVGMTAYGCR